MAQVAAIAGLTVRTLHHWDRVGLLVPGARSESGYRLYGPSDLARVREVIVWRRLGVPLQDIARVLDDPDADRMTVLRRQRELVGTRIDELRDLARALDEALESTKEDDMATDQEIIEALGGFDPADHEAEVHERWGDGEAYRESARRTSSYAADDWRAIKAEAAAIDARLRELFDAGAEATGDEAIEQAEAFRAHVSRWFYECPAEFLRGLGDMYVADPRFRAHYEDSGAGGRPGMAAWVRDAWHARADRG